MEFIVDNVDKTVALGTELGKRVQPGDILCLIGDLGTGKTHLTKGIAAGLGINDPITSPTFTIVNEYEGRLKLFHFDVYRVNDPDEIYAIGFDEYIYSDSVTVIEWANYIESLIPPDHVRIIVEKMPEAGEAIRKITIQNMTDSERYSYIKEITL